MKKFLVNFIKTHPFLFAVIIISCILALIPMVYLLIECIPKYWLYSLILWIPVLIIILFQLGAYFLHKKFPKFTKIATCLLNILLLFIFFILEGFIFWVIDSRHEEYISEKPEYYQTALKLLKKEHVFHFPRKIPLNAKNPEMFFRTEFCNIAYLKFNIDEQYIRNELSKYSFEKIVNKDELAYNFLKKCGFKAENLTYYLIKDELKEKNKCLGVAVNSNF